MQINWDKENIVKIGNEIKYDITLDSDALKSQRNFIEPWLTAVFQSEHFSLLTGNGLSMALASLADIEFKGMEIIDFENYGDEIATASGMQSKQMGRNKPNIEDNFRAAFELYNGLIISDQKKAEPLREEIENKLLKFIKDILMNENKFLNAEKAEEALKYLKSFIFSFASRTSSRERLNIFTTNYDRFIEYACDLSSILILDRFIGKIQPIFRLNNIDLDYHYNPPGIRGEPRYVEGVVRYTKIHGSLDWRFKDDKIIKALLPFGVDETHPEIPNKPYEHVVIYPNSSKGIETVFYPYAELFRDFSCAVSRPNSVVVTFGYGFGDSHINRILEDMINVPSTHIVIISYDQADGRIKKFVEKNNFAQFTLLIGNNVGDFKTLVENYLPKAAIDRITERQQIIIEKRGITRSKNNQGDI